ncbi:MAG: YigZ family protein [Chloroflexi bacterium]|nr:YigZ family protein [Chloroflexota bacterium]
MSNDGYLIPTEAHREEIVVMKSRFIADAAYAPSVEEAKAFIAARRTAMPDANHHVYAFRVGFGNSVIEGMSDDGEPSGTSGPPVLAVVRGTAIGDIVLVVTRYFGGTKLGTGGLVRAYSDAARAVLEHLPTEPKIPKALLGIETPYHFYEQIKRLISAHEGEIDDETFAGEITLMVVFPAVNTDAFSAELIELTAGSVAPLVLSNDLER